VTLLRTNPSDAFANESKWRFCKLIQVTLLQTNPLANPTTFELTTTTPALYAVG
jgi:hypothetical protein